MSAGHSERKHRHPSAMRDLELLDPAAKRVKGGLGGRIEKTRAR